MTLAPQDLSALTVRQGNYFAAGVALERDLSTYGLNDEDILVERRGFPRVDQLNLGSCHIARYADRQ